jgi:hypothetical protein
MPLILTVQPIKTVKVQQINFPTQPTLTLQTPRQLHKPLLTVTLQRVVVQTPHHRQRAITTHQVLVGVIQQLLMIMTPISILIFIRPQ